jgi:hypothetical protein
MSNQVEVTIMGQSYLLACVLGPMLSSRAWNIARHLA